MNDWRVGHYQSGTVNVEDRSGSDTWLSVYGPRIEDDDEYQSVRLEYAHSLCRWLRGEEQRPAWLDDMERVSESRAVGADGTSITACGPMYDADPPKLSWRRDESEEGKAKRARLMDRVFLPSVYEKRPVAT